MNKNIYYYIILMPLILFCSCAYLNKTNKEPLFQLTDYNVQLELITDSIWLVPSQGKQTRLSLALEITNIEDQPLVFPIMDKITISLKSENGDELKMNGGQDILLPNRREKVTIQSEKKYVVPLFAELTWADNQLQLRLKDDFGSIWWIGPLQPGFYFLNMTYENTPEKRENNVLVWTGKANIKPFQVQINK